MNLSAGVSLGQLLLAFGVLLSTASVAWGTLMQRVKTLEKEVAALSSFADRLTRIEERTGYVAAEISKITGSWLFKQPPGYEAAPQQPATPRQRK